MAKTCYALVAAVLICAAMTSPSEGKASFSGLKFMAEAVHGEHLSHNMTVAISSDELASSNFSVEAMDMYQSPSGYLVGAENPDIAEYSAKNFLSISPKNFSLEPGESQDINIEADMPEGDGCRYAIIFIHTVPHEGGGVGISVGAYASVFLTIAGSELIKTGEIGNLSMEMPLSFKQQNISMAFKNTGNYHYKIKVSATLKDYKGNILASAIPDTGGSIIPTAIREIDFSLTPKSELAPGTYTIGVEVALQDGTMLATKEIKFEYKI